MEPIKLHFPFNKDEFIEEQLFRYTLLNKSYKKQWVQLLILTPLFFAAALFYHGKPTLFNVFSALTLLAFMFGFGMYAMSKTKKKDFEKMILRYADKYQQLQLTCDFELSDQEIKYRDDEKLMCFKWHCLTRFSFEENYLVLWLENNPYFILDLNKISPTIKEQIEKLLHQKVPFSEPQKSTAKKRASDQLIDQ